MSRRHPWNSCMAFVAMCSGLSVSRGLPSMSLCSRSPHSASAHPQNRGDTSVLVSYLVGCLRGGGNVNIRYTHCMHICRLTLSSSGGFCEGPI